MIFLSLLLTINSVVFKFKRIRSFATKHDSHNFLQITKNRRFKQSSSFTKLTVTEQHNEVAKVFFLRDDNRLQICCCFISKFFSSFHTFKAF